MCTTLTVEPCIPVLLQWRWQTQCLQHGHWIHQYSQPLQSLPGSCWCSDSLDHSLRSWVPVCVHMWSWCYSFYSETSHTITYIKRCGFLGGNLVDVSLLEKHLLSRGSTVCKHTYTCMYSINVVSTTQQTSWQSHMTLAHLFDCLCRYGGLTHNGFASPFSPVDGRWLLVCAVIPTQANDLHGRENLCNQLQGFLHTLQGENT